MPPFDWRSLLDAAPVIAGAIAPDPLVGTAIIQGHLASMERMREEQLRRQQVDRQNQLTQAQIAHLSAQNQHLGAQNQHFTTQNEIAGQHAGIERGRLALENLKAFYNESAKATNFAEANAEDPLTAQNALTTRLAGMASGFGLPPSATAGLLPNMIEAVSRRAKAAANDLIEGRVKGAPDEPITDANSAFTWHDQPAVLKKALLAQGHREGEPIKPSELMRVRGGATNPQTGETVLPGNKPPGTELERLQLVLERLQAAKESGDTATVQRLQRHYDNQLKVIRDQAAARAEPDVAPGLTPGGLSVAAHQYAMTGQLPPMGMGSRGANIRAQIINEAAKVYQGLDLPTQVAAYKANQASLVKLQGQSDQLLSFEKTAGRNLDQFLLEAKSAVDSGSPLINRPLRALGAELLGNPNVAAYQAARSVMLPEFARIISNPNLTGVLSDTARTEIEGLLKGNATLKQAYAVARILRTDASNRTKSISEQIADVQRRIATPPGSTAPSVIPETPSVDSHDILDIINQRLKQRGQR